MVRNNSSVSELTLLSSALLKSDPADNRFSSPSYFVSTSRMTSGENIDSNWNVCSSLSKSAGSLSLQENNVPFCCSLGNCHDSGCFGPRARHGHSAGPKNLQKLAPAPGNLIRCYAYISTHSRYVQAWRYIIYNNLSIIICFGCSFRWRSQHLCLRIETSGPHKLSHLRNLTNGLD